LDADRTALLALTQYEAKDYYSARESAAYALQKYNVLETAFNAWLLRQEIRARGFEGYDPDNFELGGEIISGAMDAYMADDLTGAREKAEEALSTFNMVLSTSWASYAELRSSLAEGERLAALDMKTDIAAKDFFRMADSDNKTALDMLRAEKYEDAARLFINAEAMFVVASITTLEKRRTADAALRNAQETSVGIQDNEYLLENRRLIKLAEEAFSKGDYDASARFADDAAYLAIQPDVNAANMAAQQFEGLEAGPIPLPATYTVRPWSVSKDCFWNIAGFPWVHGNPHQWRLLYNANKSKLPDPNNPNLLEPGIVLDIPSIKGEVRQGAWTSGMTYEPLK
jgi:HEPN domain-containing protein